MGGFNHDTQTITAGTDGDIIEIKVQGSFLWIGASGGADLNIELQLDESTYVTFDQSAAVPSGEGRLSYPIPAGKYRVSGGNFHYAHAG